LISFHQYLLAEFVAHLEKKNVRDNNCFFFKATLYVHFVKTKELKSKSPFSGFELSKNSWLGLSKSV